MDAQEGGGHRPLLRSLRVPVAFGVGFPTLGSEQTTQFLCEGIEGLTGGKWIHEPDPVEMARILIELIEERRRALKLQVTYT